MTENHTKDAQGHPAGGLTTGIGMSISWQNGPLGQGDNRAEPNGAQVEDVIDACIGRLEFFQASEFSCNENRLALLYLEIALTSLRVRTKDRETRAVEGTHAQ